jgi:MFS family permease
MPVAGSGIADWLQKNRLLAGFLAVSITAGSSAGIMQLVLPLYALDLGIGDAGIGMIRGMGPIGGMLTTLPGGFLIDRFGPRRIYIISGLLDVLFIVLLPTATSRELLMAYLFIGGGVATIRWTALNSSFLERLDYFGLVRAGWMRAAMAIGLSFLGPLIGGQLVYYASYPVSFGVIAAFIFLPLCFIPGFKTGEPHRLLEQHTDNGLSILAQFRQLAGNRLLLRTGVLQGVAMACNHAFLVFIIILLVKNLHYSPQVASLVVSAQGIGAVLIMFWGGDLADRFRMQRVHVACFLMQIFGLVAAGFFDSIWIVASGAVVLAMGAALLMATSYSQLARLEGRKGKISGFFFLITGSGVALGPVFSGYLASLFGIRAAFTGFLPLVTAALVFIALTWRSEKARTLALAQTHGQTEPGPDQAAHPHSSNGLCHRRNSLSPLTE